jgi:hypothetical protein
MYLQFIVSFNLKDVMRVIVEDEKENSDVKVLQGFKCEGWHYCQIVALGSRECGH